MMEDIVSGLGELLEQQLKDEIAKLKEENPKHPKLRQLRQQLAINTKRLAASRYRFAHPNEPSPPSTEVADFIAWQTRNRHRS
jgi:hypothetical protein